MKNLMRRELKGINRPGASVTLTIQNLMRRELKGGRTFKSAESLLLHESHEERIESSSNLWTTSDW